MAFYERRGQGDYLKTVNVTVNSELDKENPSQSDYAYSAILPTDIQNVMSIVPISWNLPKNIVPSFWPPNGIIVGNDYLDFQVELAETSGGGGDGGIGISRFSADPYKFSVQLENRAFYAGANVPDDANIADYLETEMNEALDQEPDMDDFQIEVVYDNKSQRLRFTITTTDPSAIMRMAFLFETGEHTDRACNVQLGFPDKRDYYSYQADTFGFNYTNTIESIGYTDLLPFKYIDLIVRQSNKVPAKRIFLTNPNSFRVGTTGVTEEQVQIDTDQPPSNLKNLDIYFLLPGGQDPRLYNHNPSVPNQFVFSILQFANETSQKPSYVRQTLTS